MLGRRFLPALAAAAALGALLTAPATHAVVEPAVTFGVPRIVDPIHVYGEPNLAVNPKTGAIHASGPQGTGTQRSIWNVSVDGGDSYRVAKATQCPDVCPSVPEYTAVGPSKSTLGPGGGDTEIVIDHNGKTYFNDLYALTCFSAAASEDDGTTIESTPLGCSTPGGDRQWMALFDPQPADETISPYTGPVPLLYMEYADQAFGDRVDYSTDGTNYNFSDKAGEYADDGEHNPNHGVPLVDQHTGDFLGLTGADGSRGLALAVGVPDETGHLTFHYNEAVSPDEIEGSSRSSRRTASATSTPSGSTTLSTRSTTRGPRRATTTSGRSGVTRSRSAPRRRTPTSSRGPRPPATESSTSRGTARR
jgi:hypothetical protein